MSSAFIFYYLRFPLIHLYDFSRLCACLGRVVQVEGGVLDPLLVLAHSLHWHRLAVLQLAIAVWRTLHNRSVWNIRVSEYLFQRF